MREGKYIEDSGKETRARAKARLEKATDYMGGGVHDALRVLVISDVFVSRFGILHFASCAAGRRTALALREKKKMRRESSLKMRALRVKNKNQKCKF